MAEATISIPDVTAKTTALRERYLTRIERDLRECAFGVPGSELREAGTPDSSAAVTAKVEAARAKFDRLADAFAALKAPSPRLGATALAADPVYTARADLRAAMEARNLTESAYWDARFGAHRPLEEGAGAAVTPARPLTAREMLEAVIKDAAKSDSLNGAVTFFAGMGVPARLNHLEQAAQARLAQAVREGTGGEEPLGLILATIRHIRSASVDRNGARHSAPALCIHTARECRKHEGGGRGFEMFVRIVPDFARQAARFFHINGNGDDFVPLNAAIDRVAQEGEPLFDRPPLRLPEPRRYFIPTPTRTAVLPEDLPSIKVRTGFSFYPPNSVPMGDNAWDNVRRSYEESEV